MNTLPTPHPRHARGRAPLAFGALSLLSMLPASAATINQTVNDGGSGWNSSLWGDPAAPPTSGNDYLLVAGLGGAGGTAVGTPDVTSRVRLVSGQGTFGGDSITVVAGTEILGKDAGTYSADVILDDGLIRWSPNTGGIDGALTGTISLLSDSVIGAVQGGTNVFTIGSILTGSSTLRLAAGTSNNQTISFDDGVGTSLNGFAGTIDIGGGNNLVSVDFNQAYAMGFAGMTMGNHSTVDVLNLGANITVETFSFGGAPLAPDTYTTAELNSQFGSGSQFTGDGTLTVLVPEPSVALLGGLGILGLLRRRR